MPIVKPDEEELGTASSRAATSSSATVLEASRFKFVLTMGSHVEENALSQTSYGYLRQMLILRKYDEIIKLPKS